MEVDGAAAPNDDIVLVDSDCRVVRPSWVGLARNFGIEFIYDGSSIFVCITVELHRCHDGDLLASNRLLETLMIV